MIHQVQSNAILDYFQYLNPQSSKEIQEGQPSKQDREETRTQISTIKKAHHKTDSKLYIYRKTEIQNVIQDMITKAFIMQLSAG